MKFNNFAAGTLQA